MLFEGCQGKKGPEIQEKNCPNCGCPVEILSTELSAVCEGCGCTVFSDKMECARYCPKARECMGEEAYEKLLKAKNEWRQQMEQLQDDEW